MRYAVASGDARVLERLSDYESREAVSEGPGVMPRGYALRRRVSGGRGPRVGGSGETLGSAAPGMGAGHADAIATLMRRALTRTRAPILSSLRRMVPQVALLETGEA
jgi:hypothetical protein